MFIARGIHHTHQSPRGAACALCLNHRLKRIKRKTPIKKPSRYPTVEPIGVGLPNPSGEVTSPLRWIPHRKLCRLSLQRSDMSIAARHVQAPRSRGAQCGIVTHRGTRRGWVTQPVGLRAWEPSPYDGSRAPNSLLHLAPEGRHVYSTRHAPHTLKPQRGGMCSLSESQIKRIKRKTPIKKPSRYPTVEPIGVGLPNPSGEVTSPLRWIPHRKLCRLSLQRSDMSIAARHVQAPRSRGAQCGIVTHRGTRRGWLPQPVGLRAWEPSPYDGGRAANCAVFSPRGATCL